jgi:hypothetical protein
VIVGVLAGDSRGAYIKTVSELIIFLYLAGEWLGKSVFLQSI